MSFPGYFKKEKLKSIDLFYSRRSFEYRGEKSFYFPLKKKIIEEQEHKNSPGKTGSEKDGSSSLEEKYEKDQSIESFSEASQAHIVDIGSKREEIIENERRSVKRTILDGFIGVHVVVPENRRRKSAFHKGLLKCSLHDISSDDFGSGVSFDVDEKEGHFHPGEDIQMRIYLNHKNYFCFFVKIRSSRFIKENGIYRHGGSVIENSFNQKAIRHFVAFIESVSTNLKTDRGDVIVSNLD